jgi:hypothetical protein
MSKKRVDAKTIKNRADAARIEAETIKMGELAEAKRLQKIFTNVSKEALVSSSEGRLSVRIKSDLKNDLSALITTFGFDIVQVGFIKNKLKEQSQIALNHKISIEKTLDESESLQDFLSENKAMGRISSPKGKLFQMLDKAYKAWALEGYLRDRVFFTKFLSEKKHWNFGVGSIPNRNIYETLETVWLEYLWYVPAAKDEQIYSLDLKAVGKNANDSDFYAVWHAAKPNPDDFKESIPTAGLLKWLASIDGQNFLNLIDAEISYYADEGVAEVTFQIVKHGKATIWILDSEEIKGPSPTALGKILAIRSFKTRLSDNNEVTVSW